MKTRSRIKLGPLSVSLWWHREDWMKPKLQKITHSVMGTIWILDFGPLEGRWER